MPHPSHYPILSQLGLNSSEALVYELLLELGPKTAVELVSPSGLGRGNVYNTLTSLKTKGLVLEESGAKTVYKAVDPETLRTLSSQRLTAAEELSRQLEAVLPGLKSQFSLITKQPTLRVFEGVEGIKTIYKEILKDGMDIYSLIGPDTPVPAIYRWLRTVYLKKRLEKGMRAIGIFSSGKHAEELLATAGQELRSGAVISSVDYPFAGEIDVFGNKIAFIDYREGSLIGIILESEALALTLTSTVRAISALTQVTPLSSLQP